ncbi:hypothetical protein HJC23_012228 [Cyclotella cryptica]|uniref:Phosphoribosyl-AMP cyclohydrolase domain-containing protein n=1 Tax=Cyclotella cryptica TaxID=29204 RepID=A0ABD3PN12_9STRA|eukprot:CCRYP_013173-RA/>CCRYP_013173-RA protein AED:0.08 eAED:0.08 QI:0/0/0/1/1/1/2/0/490
MACLPYPTFQLSPTATYDALSLPAVGRARIHPLSCPGAMLIPASPPDSHSDCAIDDPAVYYQNILGKCMLQCQTGEDGEENKKLRKKYMKQGVALASSFLSTFLGVDVSIVDVEVVLPLNDVVGSDGCLACCFLDAGCARIVLEVEEESLRQALEACDVCRLPRERIVLHFSSDSSFLSTFDGAREEICERAASVSVRMMTNDSNAMKTLADSITQDTKTKFVIQLSCNDGNDTSLYNAVRKFAKSIKEDQGHISLIDPTAQQLGYCYTECMKTDRTDGLYTTVVCTRSGEALGLVYSSKESIVAALQSGKGVYYSRSRNSLWRKGDTSGNHQTLHRIDVDCDGDALRFTVTQNGENTKAFCHLNTLTCWGEPRGLRHLEGVLQQRLVDAPAGSYTKRLFEDDVLLRDKLVEEAQELSEADSKHHVAEELADVLYFAMVRAVKAGVSIDDAVVELDRRARKVTRRQGDSKAFRIQAGNEILGKNKEGGSI